ncbi:MAG TPA: T9SS type A sorting domain-containing protein [Ignavibacteria bacterium]|nr:T9SS type A sorting domain-containing protein [Ignavibacteria bacterium]HMQ97720.1 T9SS type A sorting domain-containing protein [Ignavibacteria bacterium]
MTKVYIILLSLFFVFGTLKVSADNKEQLVDLKGNPDKFELNQNYPNPFNPSTQLSYDLKTDGNVKLTVFNLVGQSVRVLVDGFQTAGYYEVTFDANDLPAGIYLYKLQVGDYSSVKRMTLVK